MPATAQREPAMPGVRKLLVTLAALLLLVIGVITSGLVNVNAQALLAPIDEALTRFLGREVEIQGSARLHLSWQPSLVVRDVRVDNPAGFPDPLFGTIRELQLDSELLPLLRQQLIVRELRGQGVNVALARADDGRGNWIFESAPPPAGRQSRFSFSFDWRRLVFERAVIEYVVAGAPRSIDLDTLVLEGLTDRPLRLELQGQSHAQLALLGEADTAPLAGLAGQEPWPFTARLQAGQAVASIEGARLRAADGSAWRMRVDLKTPQMEEIGHLLGVALPFSGAAAVQGELESAPGLLALRELQGRVAGVDVAGELLLDSSGPRPTVTGRLTAPELRLPSADHAPPDAGAPSPTLAALYGLWRDAELNLAMLRRVNANLHLHIGRLLNSPGDIHDLTANIQADAGQLRIPATATIAGAPIEAELTAEALGPAPRLSLRLGARNAAFGGLAELLFDTPYVEGDVQRFDARLSAGGRSLAALVADVEARVAIEGAQLSYGNYAGGRPIDLHIADAEITQPRGEGLSATVRGSLRGKPFEGTAQASSIEYLLSERQTPFDFKAASGDVRLNLSGLLAEPADGSGPDIDIELSAPQSRELAPWLGFAPSQAHPVWFAGHIRLRSGSAGIENGRLTIGRSSISGDVDWQRAAGKSQVTARLAAELLAPAELSGLRRVPVPVLQRTLVDLPILPETLDFGDADLELTVQSVQGLPLDISDLAFSGQIRDGAVKPSPFSLTVEGSKLAGTLAINARDPLPAANLTLEGDEFDLGAVLRRFALAQNIQADVGKLRLQVNTHGSRLGQVFEQSSFLARFESGSLAYRDPGTQSTLDLSLVSGELRVDAGGPVSGSLTGSAGALPLQLELEAGPLRELLSPQGRWPFAMSASLAEGLWEISGLTAPGPAPATEVTLSLSGARLSGLNVLLATRLPPWGPYSFTGQLHFASNEYRFDDARIAIGNSVLLGSGALATRAGTPRLQVALVTPVIQLDDFPLSGWSLFPAEEADPGPASAGRLTAEGIREAIASGFDTVHSPLSRERLALGNAEIDIRVEQVLAGQESLGRARMAASVTDGAATLGPIEIDGRAGAVNMLVHYEPREQDAVFSARVAVDRLDYGLIATRFNPDSDIQGQFSLDLALDAVAPELRQLLPYASGHIDLAVWPEEVMWTGFDLWVGNLMRTVLPFISPATSHINCAIGFFDLHEGLLVSRALLIDTTNTRTLGSAQANFATEQFRMRFVPNHKRPRLVSLAVPVELRGSFSDYRIALRPTDALGRVAQWFTALVQVPLHWFGVGRIPRDGRDVCAEPAWQ